MKFNSKKIFIGLNVVFLVLICILYHTHAFQKVDTLILDYNVEHTATHEADPRIIVVAIDDYSLEELGQFPWDRSIYAPFLDMINVPDYEPAAIAFDIVFSEASNEDSDDIFADALATYPNVILPVVGSTAGDVFQTSIAKRDQYLKVQSVAMPYAPFAENSEIAHINRVVSHDGVIRQVWLQIEGPDGEVIPTLAYKAVVMAGADLSEYENVTDLQKFNDPVAKNTITIDYDLVTEDFLTVSFADVLYGAIPYENFKDAIVFIGFTATGLSDESGQDSGVTPLERDSRLVYVHGNIANQLIQGTQIHYLSNWIELLLIVFFFSIFVWLPWRFKNLYSFLAVVITIILILATQFYLYKWNHLYVLTVCMLFAILIAYIFNLSLKAYQDQLQKNFITRQFGRYISPDLVDKIVKNGLDIQLGGISKRITILFLDIRGFTSLSEKLTPAEVVDVLNTIFTMITNTTLEHKGTIDKFIGDAAMILFNAPLDLAKHEEQAVLTAYDIQQNMKPIHDEIKEKYGVEVMIGIGIHTGQVVIGNIGSYLRMDYTAIGDSVNVASRIESGTNGGQILVSEDVYIETKHIVLYKEGEVRLFKGKSHPIKIYELQGQIKKE